MGGWLLTGATSHAVGTYKCCNNVYESPTLLPPFTPMFHDVNTTGFTQVIE